MALNVWDCDYFPGKDKKMEEFEKWWEKVLRMHWSHQDKGVCYCAWKAALEWAKSRSTNMIGCKKTISTSEIEQELKE